MAAEGDSYLGMATSGSKGVFPASLKATAAAQLPDRIILQREPTAVSQEWEQGPEALQNSRLCNFLIFNIYFIFFFVRPHLWHMEVPKQGVESEHPAHATATARATKIQATSVTSATASSNSRSLTH